MAVKRDELKQKLAEMKPRQWLYEDIKEEMKKRGHWKAKPRGRADVRYFGKK